MVELRNFLKTSNTILKEIEGAVHSVDLDEIYVLIDAIRKADKIFCVGAGRSRLILSTFCMRLNHLGFSSYIAGSIPCPMAGKGDLVISASGSGHTPSVCAVLKKAKEAGADVTIFTADMENAELQHTADSIISINAPSTLTHEVSVQSPQLMRTLFEQTVFIITETIIAILSEGMDESEIALRHTNLE